MEQRYIIKLEENYYLATPPKLANKNVETEIFGTLEREQATSFKTLEKALERLKAILEKFPFARILPKI